MTEASVALLIPAALFFMWICRIFFECGKEFTKQDMYIQGQMQEGPMTEPAPILQDRPMEQAGFLLMHENFISNPPPEE